MEYESSFMTILNLAVSCAGLDIEEGAESKDRRLKLIDKYYDSFFKKFKEFMPKDYNISNKT